MRNFLLLAQGVDVMPLLLAIQRQPELWDQNTLRTKHPDSPHTQVSDIWLRFNELPPEGEESRVVDDCETVWYPAIHALPQARSLIFQLMTRVEGERLGRCMITRLAPGKCITPHPDRGAPAEYYDRYHIVLQSRPGSIFRCGGETVHMKAGEAWWFDNSVEHEVINNSDDDRIHLIVDIKAAK